MKIDPLNDPNNIAGSQTQLEVVELDEDAIEIEVNDDDIAYIIEDEEGNEIGFALIEDGQEVEYYYAENECDCSECQECAGGSRAQDGQEIELADAKQVESEGSATAAVLGKLGSTALKGAKAAGSAAVKVGSSAVDLGKEAIAAGKEKGIAAGAGVVGAAAKQTAINAKDAAPDAVAKIKENATASKLEEVTGITKEDMNAMGKELGDLAKEGAEVAKDLVGALADLKDALNVDEYKDVAKTLKRGLRK